MTIFGKKNTTAEMLLKAYRNLSDEERTKFEQGLKSRVDESVGAQEAVDNDKDTQSAADRIDESVGAQGAETDGETGAGDENPETAGEEQAETGGEETPTDAEIVTAENDARAAQDARLDAIEAQFADLLGKVEQLTTAFGEIGEIKSGSFGASEVGDNVDTTDEQRDDDRIMANFYGGGYRK